MPGDADAHNKPGKFTGQRNLCDRAQEAGGYLKHGCGGRIGEHPDTPPSPDGDGHGTSAHGDSP